MQLELARCRDAITGTVTVDRTLPKAFTGWIGLDAAIEASLPAEAQPDEAGVLDYS